MVTSFEEWLDDFLAQLPIDALIRANVAKTIGKSYGEEFYYPVEDVYNHKRQISPGDHRRKLKDSTIRTLDSNLAGILASLGY
jgi:hypothetical protein